MTDQALGWFNALPPDEAQQKLRACNAADRFGHELAAGRPYADATDLGDAAERISLALTWTEVEQALAAHPRIGERPAGEGAEARSSRREQASMDTAEDDVRVALAEGNRAYEEQFGHVYLVRAAGRNPAELLAELRRRLDNDATRERVEVTRQLAEITRLRVQQMVAE